MLFRSNQNVIDKVAFDQLYDSTKTAAQQLPELNRFRIKGTYQSSVSSEISLNALNRSEERRVGKECRSRWARDH